MSEICNPVSNNHVSCEEKVDKENGVDIVNYQTVGFDKNQQRTNRSLSLNFYKYEQMLGPIECEKPSIEPPNPKPPEASNKCEDAPVKGTPFIKTVGFFVSVFTFIMMAVVIFLVVRNGANGRYFCH